MHCFQQLNLKTLLSLYLKVHKVELLEKLPVEKVAARNVIIRGQLFAYYSGVHLVDLKENSLRDLPHGLCGVVQPRGPELCERATGEAAITEDGVDCRGQKKDRFLLQVLPCIY